MLAIKLKRVGKKHQASFRLIVDEKRHKIFGKNAEDVGWYNPRSKKYEVKKERILYWLGVGAQPTDTVHNVLVTAGVIAGTKRPVHKKAKGKASAPPPASAPASENEQIAKSEAAGASAPAPAPETPKEPPTAEAPKVEKTE